VKVNKNILLIAYFVLTCSCGQKAKVHLSASDFDQIQSQFNQLVKIDRSRFYFENSVFPDIILNDSLRISDLGKGHLYLRLSELHCQECIEDMALFINDHFKGRKFLIVILGQFKSERAMSIYLRRLNLLETNWFLVNEIDGHDLESTQAPYAFLLNDENRIDNLWLPHWSLPSLSNEYIMAMFNKLAK
jgi:hypothetical protein